jgi:hypothetical protein
MRCSCCQQETSITPESRPRSVVYDIDGVPFMYLLMFECRCQSTLSAVLWQDEECTAEELACCAHEAAGAELYKRVDLPIDQATYRGFFSLTHEFAERGL